MLIDSHCHLNDDALYGQRAKVIKEANDCGVKTILVVGWDIPSSAQALAIAHEFDGVFAAVGIHPENVGGLKIGEALLALKKMATDHKTIAIGEIGLDYHWTKEKSARETQKEFFIRQIELANELKLPISIHSRDGESDTFDVLKSHPVFNNGVLHCYSGSTEMLKRFAELGFYFGFDGPITYKNAVLPKINVAACPFDRILSETDSPYLSPEPHRGETNMPKRIFEIVAQMAFLRGIDQKTMEKRIQSNFQKLFHVELENGKI